MPDFAIYNKCNNRCIMCTNPSNYNKKRAEFKLRSILQRIDLFRSGQDVFLNNYRDCFTITGGEPTLSPHLFSLIAKINTLFPAIRISLLTNGRMFYYPVYVRKFLSLEANVEVVVSLHGHNASIHDKITVAKGSFEQTVKGLENIFDLRKSGVFVEIRIVIHRMNYMYLSEIVSFIIKEFPGLDRLVLMFFEIEGMAVENLRVLKLRYTDVRPQITAISKKLSFFKEYRLYHFPLCTLDRRLFPYIWRTLPSSEVSYPEVCQKCLLMKYCLGVHKGYLKFFGCGEFKPYRKINKIKESGSWYRPITVI